MSGTNSTASAIAPYCKRVASEAKVLVSTCRSLRRIAKEQFVVDGETTALGASTRDVEVMRSYLKVAKRLKIGKFVRIGAKIGSVNEQASYLKAQLEQFFEALRCNVFDPQQ